jgi:hypothetical protein
MSSWKIYFQYKLWQLKIEWRKAIKQLKKIKTYWYVYLGFFTYALIIQKTLLAIVSFIFMVILSISIDYMRGWHIGWYRRLRFRDHGESHNRR